MTGSTGLTRARRSQAALALDPLPALKVQSAPYQIAELDKHNMNGLEQGASAMRRRAQQLMRAVRSGTYEVDPLKLSRRIVGDTLASI